MGQSSYETRFVAFIDILGVSDQLLEAERSEVFARAIYGLISVLTGKKNGVFFVLPHVRNGREVEIQFDKPFEASARITALADAITMSFPERERENNLALNSRLLPILRCLDSVFWLQRGLLSLGVRTRGGISCGRMFHKRDLVLGEALVKAYRLESKVAIYPRAVIDDEIIEILLKDPVPEEIALFRNRIAHIVRVDRDGRHFVDYLGYDPIAGSFFMENEIADILQETISDLTLATDSRLREKLIWLRDYVTSSMECMTSIATRLEKNRGTEFGEVFKRSQENLRSYVESL
jgi:hypothetical protein